MEEPPQKIERLCSGCLGWFIEVMEELLVWLRWTRREIPHVLNMEKLE